MPGVGVGRIARRAGKAALATALCAAGARWAVRAWARRTAGGGRVLILSYHLPVPSFREEAQRVLPSLLVSTATLRRQLEQLARERELVSLAEACRRLAAPAPAAPGRAPSDCAVLTFDDGYAGVHDHALPILQALGVPAAAYVATGFVGTSRRFLHDRLFAGLRELALRQIPLEAARLEPAPAQQALDACARARAADPLNWLIGQVAHDRLVLVAGALERRLGMSERELPPSTRVMTWDELRALQAAGVEVGGHTVNHVALSNIPIARARAEVRGCLDDLVSQLGSGSPRHFAYPNGYHTPRVRQLVAEAGFASAATTDDLENRHGGDLFQLRRKTIWEASTLGVATYSRALAACNLDGVFAALGWQRAQLGERPDAGEEGEPADVPERQAM